MSTFKAKLTCNNSEGLDGCFIVLRKVSTREIDPAIILYQHNKVGSPKPRYLAARALAKLLNCADVELSNQITEVIEGNLHTFSNSADTSKNVVVEIIDSKEFIAEVAEKSLHIHRLISQFR